MPPTHDSLNLLPGTLDILILKTLTRERRHGYAIAEHMTSTSDDALQVGERSLYPALQRLLPNGRVTAEWGLSENNRRARYYVLTAAGRKKLRTRHGQFEERIAAIREILQAA